MLKQHSAERQTIETPPRVPLSQYGQTGSKTVEAVRAEETQPVTRTTHRLPPLLLEWHHYVCLFTVPILYAFAVVLVQRLPRSFHLSDTGAIVSVVVILPLPVILCVLLGSYLRNKRMAVLSGTLIGLAFHGANLALTWLQHDGVGAWSRPLYRTSWSWQTTFITAVVAGVVALLASVHAQDKRGRRTVCDKDRDR